MSEMREPSAGATHPASTTPAGDYYGFGGGSSLLRLGGGLGIAACVVGLIVFVAACAGLGKVVVLSLIPVGLSIPGLIVSIVAAVKDKPLITEDTHVLQALFANGVGLLGGLLEMAAWLHWPLFYK
jgi:hypothetical protein